MRFTLQPAIILATILLLNLTACTTGAEGFSGLSGTCDNPLFPVKQGAIWEYTSTGGPGGSLTYTDTITEVGKGRFTITSEFWDSTHTQEWFCQLDGLKALQIGGASAAGISTQDITAEFMTSDVTGISLPRKITPDMVWQYSLNMQGTMAMPGDTQSPSNGTYSVTMQEMGEETITVEAGVFEAVRFQASSSVEIMTTFQGTRVPVIYNAVTLIWYAPGVGFIKSIENGDFSGTAFSITTELQSYSIP